MNLFKQIIATSKQNGDVKILFRQKMCTPFYPVIVKLL